MYVIWYIFSFTAKKAKPKPFFKKEKVKLKFFLSGNEVRTPSHESNALVFAPFVDMKLPLSSAEYPHLQFPLTTTLPQRRFLNGSSKRRVPAQSAQVLTQPHQVRCCSSWTCIFYRFLLTCESTISCSSFWNGSSIVNTHGRKRNSQKYRD